MPMELFKKQRILEHLYLAETKLRNLPIDELPFSRHQLADWIADAIMVIELEDSLKDIV